MDMKTRKILFELDNNSRATFSQIAKATRLKQETVRYRIDKLYADGVIEKFLTIINTTLLGFTLYQVLIKLQNIDQSRKDSIISYLVEDSNVNWIGDLEGMYDVAFIVAVRSPVDLNKTIDTLFKRFGKFIMKKTISIHLKGKFFPRSYLANESKQKTKEVTYEGKDTVKLTEKDKELCKLLSINSRASAVEISRKIGISADSVIKHIKKLEKDKVILGYSIILKHDKISQSHYKLLINLSNIEERKLNSFLTYIETTDRVIAIIRTLAEWDYEIDLEVENIEQLKEFTMKLTEKFSDIIKDYQFLRITRMPKYTFFNN